MTESALPRDSSAETKSHPPEQGEDEQAGQSFARRFFSFKKIFWVALICILVADLWTKAWSVDAVSELRTSSTALRTFEHRVTKSSFPDEGYPWWPGVVHFRWAENYGAAFSLGSGNTLPLAILSIGVLGIILYYVWRLPGRRWFLMLCLGMISGGAIGNLHDRFFYNTVDLRGSPYLEDEDFNPNFGAPTTAVRDFLYWPFDIPLYSTLLRDPGQPPRKWPVFNVADVGITSGQVGLVLVLLFAPGTNPRPGRKKSLADPVTAGAGADNTGGDTATKSTGRISSRSTLKPEVRQP